MNKRLKALDEAFQENPAIMLGVGAAFLTGLAKLVQAVAHARGSNAYARDVNRRVRQDQKQTRRQQQQRQRRQQNK